MTDDNEGQRNNEISEILQVFGRYQIIQYLLICLSNMCITMITINYVFVVGDCDYRCRVNECEAANSTEMLPSWWPNENISRCSMPVLRSDQKSCTNDSFTGDVVPCSDWIYENNNTVVAEFNLGCQPWKINLIGTIHGLGMLISMVIVGWLSDKIGRKPTLIFCTVAGCIGQTKTLATSYNIYIIIEFIEAIVTGGNYSASMILILEITPRKYRPWAGPIYATALQLGESLFAFITYLVPNWKTVIYIINAPSIFFTVYIFLVNESPRWQIVTGKVEEVKSTIKKIAAVNKISYNNDYFENINETKLKEQFNIEKNDVREGFIRIFKSKEIMKRLLVVFTCRFTSRLVYSGMMLNSVWLPGNKHVNFFITTLMSFPGEMLAIYVMYKIGRKITLMVGYSFCGLLCIMSALTPVNYSWAKLLLFFLSKMIITLCFSATITYSMELFPTSVRGTLLGLGSFGARTASMISAISPALNTIMEGLPLLLFGCMAIISCTLLTLTAETKDLPLFDTIDQVERSSVESKVKNKNIAMIERYTDTGDKNA